MSSSRLGPARFLLHRSGQSTCWPLLLASSNVISPATHLYVRIPQPERAIRQYSGTPSRRAARTKTVNVDTYLTTNVQQLLSLKNRVVVITGGGRGIGLALAFAVAEAGGQVAVIDAAATPHAHFQKLEAICSKTKYYRSDVAAYQTLKTTFDEVAADFGRIDGIITAAGICPDQPFLERDPASVKRCFEINSLGTYYSAQLATAQMVKQSRLEDAPGAGSIVMVASIAAHQASLGQYTSDYCSSKGAVLALSRQLSVELASVGVRVNCLSPGYVMTDMTMDIAETRPGLARIFNSEPPMKRMADRTELKGGAVFLLSDASSYMTGGELLMTGAINLLDEDTVRAASAEIQVGRSIQLDWPLDNLQFPGFGRKQFQQKVIDLSHSLGACAFDDEIHINTQSGSQWDSLKHHAYQKGKVFYNGLTYQEALTSRTNGIHNWCDRGGIVGRGLLVDMVRFYENRDGKSPDAWSSFEIPIEDVKAALAAQETVPRQGDILMVRSGYVRRHNLASEQERLMGTCKSSRAIGLKANEDTIRWLYDRHFAAHVGDTVAFEAWPPDPDNEYIIHEWSLVWWGAPIGEMWDLEKLAAECQKLNRWTFFLTSAPLRVPGGTQSRVLNHIAVSVPSTTEAVAFYRDIFGFQLIGDVIHHIKREDSPGAPIFSIYPDNLNEVKIAYMSTGNGVGYEIFEFIDPKSYTPNEAFEYHRGGFFHACVTDADPDALAEKVVAAGGKRIGTTVDPLGKDIKCLYVADPWGNAMEILDISFERLASLAAPSMK
ncbi:Enoyl-(Acyl carrier protein) reductase-like protein 32 [Elsinoe fawcettii]|nr:Enoyl-(Acyl carrier protein) reductase-like protein 32 [Elsinoe fawcettii]